MAQQRQTVEGVLAEVMGGVDQYAVAGNPAATARSAAAVSSRITSSTTPRVVVP
ncbi:dihydropteroate synthase 2 FolP2 domain protein [Mycobacterium xenopi 4042]|uniref:Dihydropteroate synthase 2 FolP2 domain protein n=1 Tax=Mycobacterium xenopi 4042 TaxID=1299334 RepID=X8DZD8_MYCXE|nr:hypothetical protein I552_1199 [Mycobacterium xenopi 3993]EUA73321.1 dihydropteroate synthase 2 FolP2 domain protein [Mycobacterium xenopi 4042]